MYAVFTDGSRQYRVSPGHEVTVDYRELEPGAAVEFANVLLLADGDDLKIGRPTLEGVTIKAEVVDHPSIKTRIQKFRRRKNYKRLRGHRQWYTRVRIQSIG
jgi:large subunit ribosomal protein L21